MIIIKDGCFWLYSFTAMTVGSMRCENVVEAFHAEDIFKLELAEFPTEC